MKKELDQVKVKLTHVINDVDETVLKTKHARNRLAKVSKEFNRYTSEEVRTAYEQASDFQVQLAVLQQEEIQLRIRRDDIDRRLKIFRIRSIGLNSFLYRCLWCLTFYQVT